MMLMEQNRATGTAQHSHNIRGCELQQLMGWLAEGQCVGH